MEKRFVYLVDFEMNNEVLLPFVGDWARRESVPILLVHFQDLILPRMADSDRKAELLRQDEEQLLQELKQLRNQCLAPELKVQFLIKNGEIIEPLAELLNGPYEDLLFIGIRKTGWLRNLLLGNEALDIINKIENIIIALPEGIKRYAHNRLYVAVSEQAKLNVLAFNNFLEFLDEGQTRITFFHLAKPGEDTRQIRKQLQNLVSLFQTQFPCDYEVYETEYPAADIKKVINNKFDEFLVVQPGMRLLSDYLFRPFLVNELVLEGETPLVILP